MFLFFRREHHPDLWIEIRRSEFAAEAASLCAIRPSPNVVRPCIRDDRHSMTVAVNGWRVVQKLRIRAACGAGRRGAAALRRRGGRGVCRAEPFLWKLSHGAAQRDPAPREALPQKAFSTHGPLTHSARRRRRAPAATCREDASASPRFFDREREKKGSTLVLPR